MSYGLIYKATCKKTGKMYIGQTKKTLESRIKTHKSNAVSRPTYFNNYGKKHGWDIFVWEILEICNNQKSLNEREQFYISKYKTIRPNGFNLISRDQPDYFSDDVLLKMSKSMQANWADNDYRKDRINKFKKAKSTKIAKESCKVNFIKNKCLPLANETHRNLLKSNLAYKNKRSKQIVDIQSMTLYASYHAAERHLNFSCKHMNRHLSGKQKKINGLVFRLATENEIKIWKNAGYLDFIKLK